MSNDENNTSDVGSGKIPVDSIVHEGDGLNLTLEESKIMSQISYIDFDKIGYDPTGKTVVDVLNFVRSDIEEHTVKEGDHKGEYTGDLPLNNGGWAPQDYEAEINRLMPKESQKGSTNKYDTILNLEYTGYVNENVSPNNIDGNGIVLASLTDGKNTIVLVTGSEGGGDSVVSGTIPYLTANWIGNGTLATGKGDIGRDTVENFFANTEYVPLDRPVLVLGHSRGYSMAEIGTLQLLSNGRTDIRIIGHSGSSGYYSFTNEEIKLLNLANPMNYVVVGDIIPYIGSNIGNMIPMKKSDSMVKWSHEVNAFVRYYSDGRDPTDIMTGKVIIDPKTGEALKGLTGYPHFLTSTYTEGGFYQLDQQDFLPIFIQNLTSRLIARNPPYLDKLIEYLAGIETPLQKELADAKAKEDGLKYVVKGAKIKCNMGLRTSKLLMPKTNGVYIHDLPQADEFNNKKENIISFAGCCSMSNPNTVKANKKITDKINNRPKDTIDVKMNAIASMGLKEKFLRKNEKDRMCASYGKCDFLAKKPWIQVKENVYLTKDKALLRKSLLGCRYGGTISIIHEWQLE